MRDLILKTILEGLGLGALLVLVCAVGIRKGAVGMVHLYSREVQERCIGAGLTTSERIKRNSLLFKAICVPGYLAYVLAWRLCGEWCERLCRWFLADAGDPVGDEPDRSIPC